MLLLYISRKIECLLKNLDPPGTKSMHSRSTRSFSFDLKTADLEASYWHADAYLSYDSIPRAPDLNAIFQCGWGSFFSSSSDQSQSFTLHRCIRTCFTRHFHASKECSYTSRHSDKLTLIYCWWQRSNCTARLGNACPIRQVLA